MVRKTFRWSSMSVIALMLAGCGLASIPIEAPKEPIRIEATVILKHEYVLLDSAAQQ